MATYTQRPEHNNVSLEKVTRKPIWMRALNMVLFVFIHWMARMVGLGIVVLQFLIVLFTGTPNDQLQKFGYGLTRYITQIWDYLQFNSEQRPFPFADWPDSRD